MVRNYGIPPGVPGHTEAGRTEQEAIRIDMSQRRYDLDGLWKTYWPALPKVKAKLSYIDYDHKDYDKSVTDRSSSLTRFNNSVWESRLEMNHQREGGSMAHLACNGRIVLLQRQESKHSRLLPILIHWDSLSQKRSLLRIASTLKWGAHRKSNHDAQK
ncbi:MAG: hypothetical protein IPP67_09735 [Rhodospirillaceae bacterium]|nr:hypothetical protein [Rhodospirillaceae bacterium]